MSDFDKEAERERLREKYEAEREDREATQHMSELLLKGATMTNSHCGNCGDPIFRYDGQEFCPTCSNQPGAVASEDASTQSGDAQPQETASGQTDDVPTQEASTAQDGTTTPTRAAGSSGQARPGTRPPESNDGSTPDATASAGGATDAGGATPGATDENVQAPNATDGNVQAPSATDAVANVEATVERFAAAAANTDDPERAREYLAAVRDATDTLRALRGDAR